MGCGGTLGQEVGELLVGALGECGLGPHVWGQVCVGVADSLESGLGEVAKGGSLTGGRGITIVNTSHHQQLLGDTGSNETSTTGCGDETHTGGTALASDLAGHGMGLSDLVTPVSTTDWDNGELSVDDGTTDGGGNFLGALDSKTDVSVVVTDGNESLE